MHARTNGQRPETRVGAPSAERCLEFRLGVDPFWLSPLRSLVSVVGLRAELNVDAAADLVMAVDEAVAALMAVAASDDQVTGRIEVTSTEVGVAVSLLRNYTLPTETFGWRVLRTLADRVDLMTDPTGIVLRKGRAHGDG